MSSEIETAIREIKRRLNGDVLQVLMDVSNGIDSPALRSMAASAVVRLDGVKDLLDSLSPPSSATPGECDCCGANPDVCDACEEAITQPQERAGSEAGAVAWQVFNNDTGEWANLTKREAEILAANGSTTRALFTRPQPSAVDECQHDWVRDEEAVTYHCCQRCGAVKRDTPQPASDGGEEVKRIEPAFAPPPAVNGSVASALSDEPRFNRVAAAIAKAPQPQDVACCTCPSGDGSLRWPCPKHPPELYPQPASDASGGELAARLDRAAGIRSDGEAKLMLDAAEMIRTLSRALAESRALLSEALRGWDDVIEDLELNGLHDDPRFAYRRQKEWLSKVEAKAGVAFVADQEVGNED